MAYSCSVSPSERFVRITFTGATTTSDIIGALDELSRLADSGPLFALWDYRQARSVDVLPGDLPSLYEAIARFDESVGPGRAAWIIRYAGDDQDIITSLIGRRSRHSMRVRRGFTDYEDAVRWLNDNS